MCSITTFSTRLSFTQTNGATNASANMNESVMVTPKLWHREKRLVNVAERNSLNKVVMESVSSAISHYLEVSLTRVALFAKSVYAVMIVEFRATSTESDLKRVQIALLLNESMNSIF